MPDTLEGQSFSAPDPATAFRSSLQLLVEIGREVSADLDLRTLLHRVLFLAMRNIGAVSGSIIVLDSGAQVVDTALLILGQTTEVTAIQLQTVYEQGLAGWVAHHRQGALVANTRSDPRWLQRLDETQGVAPAKSAVSAPILARDNLVGVITLVHPQPGAFTEDHLALVEAIGGWAGTAILQAQLLDRLKAANRRYQELFEDSIDLILITDWGGRLLEFNRQAQQSIALLDEDVQSLHIAFLGVVETDKVGREFENLRQGQMVTYERTLVTRMGNEIPVQVYARAINTDGEAQIQWIVRDLSERKDLDRLREDLAAMIYHDLRSPLGNIVSSIEMLSGYECDTEDENVRTVLDIARRATDRIQRLTQSLLDVHRLETGRAVDDLQVLDMSVLLQEALENIEPLLSAAGQAVDVCIDPETPAVLANADMIRRVLINLLDNAHKYSPKGASIRVEIAPQDRFVLTQIKDHGPGLSPANRERIFDKFTRIATKDGPTGLGLGLAFCRLAINAHGGRIWVESEPGNGSTFLFTLKTK